MHALFGSSRTIGLMTSTQVSVKGPNRSIGTPYPAQVPAATKETHTRTAHAYVAQAQCREVVHHLAGVPCSCIGLPSGTPSIPKPGNPKQNPIAFDSESRGFGLAQKKIGD